MSLGWGANNLKRAGRVVKKAQGSFLIAVATVLWASLIAYKDSWWMVEINWLRCEPLVAMSKCNLLVVFSAIHDGTFPHGLNHTTCKSICDKGVHVWILWESFHQLIFLYCRSFEQLKNFISCFAKLETKLKLNKLWCPLDFQKSKKASPSIRIFRNICIKIKPEINLVFQYVNQYPKIGY